MHTDISCSQSIRRTSGNGTQKPLKSPMGEKSRKMAQNTFSSRNRLQGLSEGLQGYPEASGFRSASSASAEESGEQSSSGVSGGSGDSWSCPCYVRINHLADNHGAYRLMSHAPRAHSAMVSPSATSAWALAPLSSPPLSARASAA